MSSANVETFKHGIDAYNRHDIEAMLAIAHPDAEWHPALIMRIGGERSVYRGADGIRQLFRDVDETLAEIRAEFDEIREVGDRVVATGRLITRGRASGATTESPLGYVADFRDGKIIRVRTYLDPAEALAAAAEAR